MIERNRKEMIKISNEIKAIEASTKAEFTKIINDARQQAKFDMESEIKKMEDEHRGNFDRISKQFEKEMQDTLSKNDEYFKKLVAESVKKMI